MHHWPVAMWEFNLGCMVHNIRNRSHQLDTAQLDDLIDVGFVFDARTGVWEGKILAARPVFAHERGHARVPQGFIVPAYEPWPKLAWGMRLGSAVARVHQGSVSEHAHRDADKLDAIGFVWSVTDDTWREAILPSLEMFHQREGHCHVPSSFTVPRGDLWPRRAWEWRVGRWSTTAFEIGATMQPSGSKIADDLRPSASLPLRLTTDGSHSIRNRPTLVLVCRLF